MDPPVSPLVRWDGLHLVLDIERIERHLNDLFRGRGLLEDIVLDGRGDAIAAAATVTWKGVPARVGLELAEIRLRHRHLGFRMRHVRALGGFPVPRAAVEVALARTGSSVLTVVPGQGIVVIDLRRWIPEQADVRVLTVQATSRSISVWLGPGRLADLPGRGRRALPAGTRAGGP